jgi:hypothetical protein
MEAVSARREAEARKAKDAEERVRAEAQLRLEEHKRRLQEHEALKRAFAATARQLEQRLERLELRTQTAQRRAAWAERAARLPVADLEPAPGARQSERRDDQGATPGIEASPRRSMIENGDGQASSDRTRKATA